ncbi:MAG TPA: DUF962 domain-containing protein [Steroidobacteraceae bacterium]|nr:DUF962 domain-containing protein [Steroidobacteraceae bacterium]
MTARTRKSFANLREFYAFYLGEHGNRTCRRLHFCGTALAIAGAAGAAIAGRWWPIAAGILCAYALAWVGHFFFERNSPATFRYPLRSLACDFLLFRDMLTGRIAL